MTCGIFFILRWLHAYLYYEGWISKGGLSLITCIGLSTGVEIVQKACYFIVMWQPAYATWTRALKKQKVMVPRQKLTLGCEYVGWYRWCTACICSVGSFYLPCSVSIIPCCNLPGNRACGRAKESSQLYVTIGGLSTQTSLPTNYHFSDEITCSQAEHLS